MPQRPPAKDTVESLLIANIPKSLVMAIDESLRVGATRAYLAAKGMDEGHLPHVVGQLRHFQMNEAFHRALSANNASPSEIRGNSIVTGRANIFSLGRFNIPTGFWINGRRSKTRRQMAFANRAIEPLVQPGLFEEYTPPASAVAFFVACFSGNLQDQPEAPISIQIAIPDQQMRGWLYREPLDVYLKLYEQRPDVQEDLARPTLKKNVRKRNDGTGQ